MIAIYIIIGVVLGFLIGHFLAKQKSATKEIAIRQSLTDERIQSEQRLTAEKNESVQQVLKEKGIAEQRCAVAEMQLEQERKHAEEMREEITKQAASENKLMQEKIRNMMEQMLKDSRKELTSADKERLDALLNPLKEKMEAFSKAVNDNNRDNAAHKTEIKTAFEEAMKRLHDEQERTVRELKEQTERIGTDAASLTQALKGDSKLQGDWGEMILEKTLEDCGLQKDEQYSLQENYKDEDGNNFRPDAVVNFPNGERVVIDSKVSLTSYLEAVKTDDAQERERLLNEHILSVKRHVDELTEKNYDKLIPGCIGYVLMFIPYESGYAAAVKADAGILQYAFKKKIIIISPANLLMTLQLTHTMWQNFRMNKNVEEILRQSNDLYDKFVTFAETFLKIGSDIDRLHADFEKAQGQLSDGRGNVIRRLEGMKQLGITPKKEIPDSL